MALKPKKPKKTRAKKSEPSAAPRPSDGVPDDGPALLMPPVKLVPSLVRQQFTAKEKKGEIAKVFKEALDEAVQKKHIDRKAFAIASTLHNLADEKLIITYFHLLRYMDDLGIPARAKAAEGLFPESETGAGETHVEDSGDGTVVSIGRAARRVAERAGTDDVTTH